MPTIARDQLNTDEILNWYIYRNSIKTDAYKVEYEIFDKTSGTEVKIFPVTGKIDVTDEPGRFDTGSYYAYDPTTGLGWHVPVDANLGTWVIKWSWKATVSAPEQADQEEFTIVDTSEGSSDELIITVEQLQKIYLHGIDMTDDDGNLPDDMMYEHYIKTAQNSLEMQLGIAINEKTYDEYYDYHRQDYLQFNFIQLFHFPVIEINEVTAQYPLGSDIITFDESWYRIMKEHGQLQLVPTSGTFSQILAGSGALFLPMIRNVNYIPQLWHVIYKAGFRPGTAPQLVKDCIGKLATFGPLNIAGDLIAGLGIASQSLGIDGLSQGISTTKSPSSAAFSTRLNQYLKELDRDIRILKDYYKGRPMVVA